MNTRPPRDRDGALVELERDRTGHALLRHGHERVVRVALGGPPTALIHEIRIARRDEVLRRERTPIEHELLELGVRRVQEGAAGRLVYATGLHTDEAIL